MDNTTDDGTNTISHMIHITKKMNVGEQKVSKVQGTVVHDQLEVSNALKLSNDCSLIVLDSREQENQLVK